MKKQNDLAGDEQLIMAARSRWTSYILPAVLLAGYLAVWHLARKSGEDTLTFHVLMAAIGVWRAVFRPAAVHQLDADR